MNRNTTVVRASTAAEEPGNKAWGDVLAEVRAQLGAMTPEECYAAAMELQTFARSEVGKRSRDPSHPSGLVAVGQPVLERVGGREPELFVDISPLKAKRGSAHPTHPMFDDVFEGISPVKVSRVKPSLSPAEAEQFYQGHKENLTPGGLSLTTPIRDWKCPPDFRSVQSPFKKYAIEGVPPLPPPMPNTPFRTPNCECEISVLTDMPGYRSTPVAPLKMSIIDKMTVDLEAASANETGQLLSLAQDRPTSTSSSVVLKSIAVANTFGPKSAEKGRRAGETEEAPSGSARVASSWSEMCAAASLNELKRDKQAERKAKASAKSKSKDVPVKKVAKKAKKAKTKAKSTRVALLADEVAAKKVSKKAKSSTARPSKAQRSGSVKAQPSRLDVLSGRGGRTNRHVGNLMFRTEAKKMRRVYQLSCTDNDEKRRLNEELSERVKAWGGRFLKKRSDGFWYEMDAVEERKKVAQALRENKW